MRLLVLVLLLLAAMASAAQTQFPPAPKSTPKLADAVKAAAATKSADNQVKLGLAHYAARNYKTAVTQLEKVADVKAGKHLASVYLAWSYLGAKKASTAAKLFEKTATLPELSAVAPDLLIEAGDCYMTARQPALAEEAYRKSFNLRPKNAPALFGLGIAQVARKRIEGALSSFLFSAETATDKKSKAKAKFFAARAADEMGLYAEAKIWLQQARDLDKAEVDRQMKLLPKAQPKKPKKAKQQETKHKE